MRKNICNYTYNFEPEMYKYILSTNILNKKKETRYKISREIGTSERTIGNEIIKLKNIFKNYCDLQETKATINASLTKQYEII